MSGDKRSDKDFFSSATRASDFERSSICFAQQTADSIVQHGDADFRSTLEKHYDRSESQALEAVIRLKEEARRARPEEFPSVISAGLARLFDAQWGLITKRLDKDEDTGAALPSIGDPDSRFLAISWFYDDGKGSNGSGEDLQYHAHSCPCAYMRHNKVFIIPSHYQDFVPNDPNQQFLPFEFEAEILLPIFVHGQCVGHFGVLWSKEGAARRRHRWPLIEAILHSIEDLISQRLLEAGHFPNVEIPISPTVAENELKQQVSSSLKPYARTLSHELRTPMQGVTGMLDLMYSNVQELLEAQPGAKVKSVFQSLKEDIEVIQDSSRRAVEAAENVTAAYDMGMAIPPSGNDDDTSEDRVELLPPSSSLTLGDSQLAENRSRGVKRTSSSNHTENARPRKVPLISKPLTSYNERRRDWRTAVDESEDLTEGPNFPGTPNSEAAFRALQKQSEIAFQDINAPDNRLQYIKIDEMFDYIIYESMRVGQRPQSTAAREIKKGQAIESVYKSANGELRTKIVEWTIDSSVPETFLVHEKHLAKLVSCVLQNALKFTESGKVTVNVSLCHATNYVTINIADTGRGIHPSFRSRIFKPFSREDNSISRKTEGLGLGLLVAKGLSRKLGGDLALVRSETEEPDHGSEFEIKIPVYPGELSTPASNNSLASTAEVPDHHYQTLQSPVEFPNSSQIPSSPSLLRTKPNSTKKNPVHSFLEPPPRPISPPTSTPSRTHTAPSLAATHPATFLVAEDNMINRRLLVSMLVKLGYDRSTQIYEAYDGADAFRQAKEAHERLQQTMSLANATNSGSNGTNDKKKGPIDMILMDLWMPSMDGYEATEKILGLYGNMRRNGIMRRCISEPGTVPGTASRRPSNAQSLSVDAVQPGSPQEGAPEFVTDDAILTQSSPISTTTSPTLDAGLFLAMAPPNQESPESPHHTSATTPEVLPPTILAVTADATDDAAERASKVGMEGFLAKPFNLKDLEKLVKEGWAKRLGRVRKTSIGGAASVGSS